MFSSKENNACIKYMTYTYTSYMCTVPKFFDHTKGLQYASYSKASKQDWRNFHNQLADLLRRHIHKSDNRWDAKLRKLQITFKALQALPTPWCRLTVCVDSSYDLS